MNDSYLMNKMDRKRFRCCVCGLPYAKYWKAFIFDDKIVMRYLPVCNKCVLIND